MDEIRQKSSSWSPQSSIPRSSLSSSSDEERELQLGRPSKWTPSRQRKAARLYLFSKLPTEEISVALQEKDWLPGDESTKKVVSSLLSKQPRWLRPKNKGEIDQRIAGLSECKTNRRTKRNLILSYKNNWRQSGSPQPPLSTTLSTILDSTNTLSNSVATESEDLWPPIYPVHEDGVQTLLASWDMKALFPEEYFESYDPLPTVGEDFEFIANDQHSLSTYWSTSSLKKRLPHYSSQELKDFVKLMKAHSISNSSAATIKGIAFTFTTTKLTKYESPSLSNEAHPLIDDSLGPLLADSLLSADWHKERQGVCIPGLPLHDLRSCWCAAIESLKSNCQTWINVSQGIDVTNPFLSSPGLDLSYQDDFGNSVLHFLATQGARMAVVINAIERGADPHAKNTANQTFLHLFPSGLLAELASRTEDLRDNLRKIQRLGMKLYDCDHFGRTPLHSLSSQTMATYPYSLWIIAQHVRLSIPRDAFGNILILEFLPAIPPDPFIQIPIMSVLRSESQSANNVSTKVQHEMPNSTPALVPETWLSIHKGLLETAQLAFDTPNIEDKQGRNGLHCLAEASLNMIVNGKEIAPVNYSRKRKRKQLESNHSPSRLALRYEVVQTMIHAGVDVNHLDKKGNLVLIAFVTHLPDGEDDKTLRNILNYLISKGANLHCRNRRGETGLHVAVRLGRKVATTTLLQNGANVHARTADLKGVLAVGEKAYFNAKDMENQQLYASIMACHALAFQYGAVPNPTIVQEWSKKEGFAMYLKLQNSIAKGGVKKRKNVGKEVNLNAERVEIGSAI